ncbi:asparagine synthase (glutamine-hydrolyzing) [Flavihumibacter sp. CACIAM 22H1]|uniref:asparagine synthase (glutamine-hydrolyzing) n=1 Tax=Flavihumibacter sp. CACIAM 22H1 TaxID=1812911 RepID=UPI0007A843B3|nr:asparagine synthase (glutamine-hydrolyzing) [Flavihumibacter sp. CACIAM 22H1]KYP15118.1 MAG: hypothetical protein A1D16_12465 [Flavihumibacter sp. CACIAM 22H1]
MCGIAGAICLNHPLSEAPEKINIDALNKRGPDDRGIYKNEHVLLGHRRLSIIDLNTGHQPMLSQDGSVVIVFNGEIYNFKELRKALIASGHHFSTSSDTEVIIHGYQQYGIQDLLNKLEGMFAFALYDKKQNKCYIARDKFGEKPLYYGNNGAVLYFSSELKALVESIKSKALSIEAINLFLTLSYIPAPYSIYANVFKLPAANYLELHADGRVELKTYFDLQNSLGNGAGIKDYSDAKSQLKELVYKSVEARMIADVPIGAFLSGGIDSSIISSVMAEIHSQPINTFSIGFNEPSYDESKRAQLISRHIKSNHEVFFLDFKDAFQMLDEITEYFDEPFGDSSALPSYFVSRMAAEHVKVVLTGDAADELFGGYEKYLAPHYSQRYQKIPRPLKAGFEGLVKMIPHTRFTNATLRKVKKVISNSELDAFNLHYSLMSLGFSDTERRKLLKQGYLFNAKEIVQAVYDGYSHSANTMDKGFYTDLKFVLEGDMLTKVDRMCMINSLEARVPFLDSSIVEFAFQLPVDFKIQGTDKKRILKDTFKYLLPPETLKFSKKGFGVPVNLWMRNELKSELKKYTSPSFIEKQSIFDVDFVNRVVTEHMNGLQNHTAKLWNLFIFQKWYTRNILTN